MSFWKTAKNSILIFNLISTLYFQQSDDPQMIWNYLIYSFAQSFF